jgi:CheY-like chemotaxis protein
MDSPFKYKMVMIVDDTPLDRLIFEDMARKSDFAETVVKMGNGLEAINYLKANPDSIPDLIFLDIQMPTLNGIEFLAEYEKIPGIIRKKSIVILTSSLNETDRQATENNPYVIRYINKPLSMKTLQEF